MKNLADALKEIHPKLNIYRLYKELRGSVTINTLYLISNDPEKDIKLSTASLIFDITKNKYGRGLAPWEYTMCQDFRNGEVKFNKKR